MVKTKINKKSKPNNNNKQQHNGKKNGKKSDISEFRAQLDALGLKIIEVTADGNCFFRSLADQLDGDEDKHEKYRKMVVQYIMKNRENFEPFIEDEVPFDEYCQSMEKDGTWAGNMELQAASLVTHSNICIHLKSSPRWYIKNFGDHDAQMIHLSYHDWEHYNSVRSKEDTCDGPARPIIIKGKKNGKKSDISEFRAQLDALGLKIIEVTADGNCFFRSLADQLDGDEDKHEKYRKMVVQYIMKNRENFEPFIEDEVPFDEYCQSMEKDGTWAGNMELQAASLVTHSNICIHLKSSPRWYIKNFGDHDAQMIHLSYHDWEHYNSVRSKEDTCDGPARPIIIKADADLTVKSHQANGAVSKAKDRPAESNVLADSIRTVQVGSGCENEEKIQQVLLLVDGDVDAAIEFIIADQVAEESFFENDRVSFSESTSHECSSNDFPEHAGRCGEKIKNKNIKEIQTCSSTGRKNDKTNSLLDEKKIPRNKACPCGSKKKHKSCCGTASGRSSTVAVNNTVDYGKGKIDKKQGKKGGSANLTVLHGSDGVSPDMGALCI
ncbi:Ovarian tumor, otubain [Artemisia annua]|uniref:Ovarian tumor, otubain n=1 Tax=Artemisia annua TaxID=35608 RepID=A0A2U1LPU2_ARTAN|nr:Ovarian tumor, otubain [Artemisia annua]